MRVVRIGIVLGLFVAASACDGGGSSDTSTPVATSPMVTTEASVGTTEPRSATTVVTTTVPSNATELSTSTVPVPPTTVELTPAPNPTMVDVKVYFWRGERLAIAHRTVAAPAVLRGALDAVVAGPTADERAAGLTTEVPAGTTLSDVSVADGQAIVDFTGEYESGGGSLSMTARLAQVIFTATQFDVADRVLFWLDGEPVRFFGGEGITLHEPQARMHVDRALSGGIIIDTPVPGTAVRSPFAVTGEGDLFEGYSALWIWRDGEQIAGPFGVQAGAWGTWDEFETVITLDVPPGPIELIVDDGGGCTAGDPECGAPNPAVLTLTLTD